MAGYDEAWEKGSQEAKDRKAREQRKKKIKLATFDKYNEAVMAAMYEFRKAAYNRGFMSLFVGTPRIKSFRKEQIWKMAWREEFSEGGKISEGGKVRVELVDTRDDKPCDWRPRASYVSAGSHLPRELRHALEAAFSEKIDDLSKY